MERPGKPYWGEEQLKNALNILLTDDPEQFVVILPDAGAVINKNILRQYQTTVKAIADWGYGDRLRFGWWGQVTKTDGRDCDEIDRATEIEYLTIEQFFILTRQQLLWEKWRETKAFTAEIKLNQQYLDFKTFEDKMIYFIKSGLGSGKTTNMKAWIDENREWLHHNRLHFQGYRNNLLLQNCESIPGLIHIHQFGECDYICDPDLWAAYCLDSIVKFKPEDFDDGVVVIDEVVSVIKHLLFASTEIAKYREKAINLFIESIKRARMVICLDGNMADWVVKFFESIQTGKGIVTIENNYQTERSELFWLTGGLNKKGELSPNDYKPLIDRILNPENLGSKAVTSDSQTALETIDSLLTKSGKITLRIDSKTSGMEVVKAFLANPTQWLRNNPIDYLLYSPTAESGLDVPIVDYFTAHYCLFFGVLDVDSTLQQIARIRDVNCPKYLWAREWSTSLEDFKSPIAEVLARVANERLNLDLQRALSGEENGADIIGKILETYQTPFKAFEDAAFYLQAQRNFERGHFRSALLERAKIAGYRIIEIEPTEAISGETYKAEKEELLITESEEIFKAEIKPVNKLNPDRIEDQRSLRKIKLLDQLPGIENDPIWSEDFIFAVLFKEKQLLSQARRAWMLNHITVVNRLEREKCKRIYDRFFEDRHSLIWTERNEWGKIWALAESGILEIINHPDQGKVWKPEDLEIENVIRRCKRKAIWLHLGRQGKTETMQYVGRLLNLVGCQWEKKRGGRETGDRRWEYRLNQKQSERPEWQAISQSLDRKWWKYIDTDLAKIDWSPPAEYVESLDKISPIKSMLDQTLQTQSEQSFEPGPPDGGNITARQFRWPAKCTTKSGGKIAGKIEYIYGGLKVIDGGVEYQDLIAYNDRQFDQLEWPLADRQLYVHRLYGKKKRPLLSDAQLYDLVGRLDNLIAEGGW
ncbi:hypothetical protein NON20_26085 (plasmid) [Synechocystis sp. B12]|nr:hypothetical protein NON20_26085 [Synechocystis sp. B12]